MSRKILSPRALASLVRAGDSRQFGVDLQNYRDQIINAASIAALSGNINIGDFTSTLVRGKTCTSYPAYATNLLFRGITKYLTKQLKITLPNRDRIVRGVIETLLDGTPMYAIRRDITSFYESIPIEPVRRTLLYDVPCSTTMRNYIRQYFITHCGAATHGLPRGIGLSAILAEHSMHSFDAQIKSIPGVFKYFRFSDDILIFSTTPSYDIERQIESALPEGMAFNKKKSSEIFFPGKSKIPQENAELDYLGYRFLTTQPKDREASRKIRVSLARRKLNKLKSRTILSLKSYSARSNWPLLRDRLHFITCNYRVRRSGTDKLKTGTHVYSGIYYNYRMCGAYSIASGRVSVERYDCAELKELDGFYNSIIRQQTAIGTIALTQKQIQQLSRFSFHKGFLLKIKGRFSPDRVAQIKKVWRNV